MSSDHLFLRLRDLCNRRLGRYEPTRAICIVCGRSVAEWVTIRWQLTDHDHWPSTDGRALALLCLDCAVPNRIVLGEAIVEAARRNAADVDHGGK